MQYSLLVPLLALTAGSTLTTTAQTTGSEPGLKQYPTAKGSVLLGANLSNTGPRRLPFLGNSSLASHVNASLRAGYFICGNLVVGATANGYFYDAPYVSAQAYGGGFFGRYYFGKAAEKNGEAKRFHPFAEAGLHAVAGRRVAEYRLRGENVRTRYSQLNAYALVGVNYFVTRQLAVDLGVSYERSVASRNYLLPNGTLGVNAGVQLYLPRTRGAAHRAPVKD